MDDVYSVYEDLYDLPKFIHSEVLADRFLYDYCAQRRYFVNVLPYTKSRHALLSPTFGDAELYWRIIGGGVGDSLRQNFITTAQSHVERYVQNVDLGEVEPVAFLENRFQFGDLEHIHRGLLFIGRVRNFDDRDLIDSLPTSRGHFVPFSIDGSPPNLPEIYMQDAFNHAVKVADRALVLVNQDHEIDSNEESRGRYIFHETVVKPAMKLASRIFGEHSIAQFESTVSAELLKSGPQSIFDIACGENKSLISLVEGGQTSMFVGNDISWSQIGLIDSSSDPERFRNSNGIIFFTNNDGRRLPFADRVFDVAICKNVLHHMPDGKSVQALLSELKRVSKKSVVIEVMDPKFESPWGRLRHRYYMEFLKDAGGNFLSRSEFADLMRRYDPVNSYEISTFRGVYQFAIMENIDP
jgi:ubiquinone/menaquinone biosynthesis C-methylase UbiE